MEKVKLLDVCEVYQPKTIATKEFVSDGGYIVYGANGPIGRYTEYNHEESEILMACRGATCGAINVSEPYSWINGNAMVVHPNGNVPLMKKYLMYFLMFANKESIITGTAQPQITRQNMREFEIVICSEEKQKSIVARIEELFSELDNGVETLRKTKQQLAVYRQAVMKVVFQGVAQNHVMVSMGEILSGIEGGKSFKCEERPPQETEYGIVKVSAVTWGTFNEEESKTCQSSQFIESKRIKAGDFLFSRANTLELVGNCVVVETVNKNLMLSDKILRFHFEDGILPKYVMYYLRTHEGKKQIQEYSTGNQESMRNIGQDRIKKINVPVCSMEEQNRVVSEIETRLSVCDSIEKTVDTALHQAEAMRQSILKKAFEGKL